MPTADGFEIGNPASPEYVRQRADAGDALHDPYGYADQNPLPDGSSRRVAR